MNDHVASTFEDKFVAFIDVLGFKGLVESAEAGEGFSLANLLECLEKLGSREDEKNYARYGPTTCPQSRFLTKGLNFKITQISDCVIVSSEISPAGVINLVSHCWGAVMGLLTKGIMCRGYITKGSIYHQNSQVIGSGYQNAYGMESSVTAFSKDADERGTPFVQIDSVVCDYVRDATDKTVRDMFSRMVEIKNGTVALFPFKRLSHPLAIGGFGGKFDPAEERESNNTLRKGLISLKERVMSYVDPENEKAMKKAKHYIAALDRQLTGCDDTDKMIDDLCRPFPAKRR